MKHFNIFTIMVCLAITVTASSCKAGITLIPTLPTDSTSSTGSTQSISQVSTESAVPTSEVTSASAESETITPATTSAIPPTPTATKAPTSAPTKAPTPTPLPKVGDIVNFGKYEQDNNLDNGKEPLGWRVLEVSDGKMLLLSDKCIDAKPYDVFKDETYWAICTLRT